MERTEKSAPRIMALLKGLLIAYLITGISLLILALLLFKMNLDEGKITIGIIVIYILSCFLGGMFVGKKSGKQKFLWGLLLGIAYFVLLTMVSAITEPGLSSGLKGIMTSFVMCMGAGMLGGMFS
ncbi:MAG: TIGR04086 family membrane protein [Clostridia bacterium]|nr:TIGR04086 family membrane protein [Clostridia bacterium]NCC43246.1 TIGR04086 family membrane protein [Clostridia bacterium]